MSPWIMRRATPHDWPKMAALLATADLPLAGAQAHLSDFFLAFRDDVLIGSAGLERYGDTALLRSIAVASTECGHHLGQALVQIESLLAARLFLSPKLLGNRLFFLSNLGQGGHLSIYAMDASGSVPEPLLLARIAVPNPELVEAEVFALFPKLGKLLLMLDRDGDENYQPMLIPLVQ